MATAKVKANLSNFGCDCCLMGVLGTPGAVSWRYSWPKIVVDYFYPLMTIVAPDFFLKIILAFLFYKYILLIVNIYAGMDGQSVDTS